MGIRCKSILSAFAVASFVFVSPTHAADKALAGKGLTFACEPESDVYAALAAGGRPTRFDSAAAAVDAAPADSGVLILARGDTPNDRPVLDPTTIAAARAKRLRLFIECPQSIPGYKLGEPRTAIWERVVVANNAFADFRELPRLRLLAANGCSFIPVEKVRDPLLVIGRVAGYDTAVYGLPRESFPILFRTADGDLVATTRISQFVTARYAPASLWAKVWRHILKELDPASDLPELAIEPIVRPSFGKADALPKDAERAAAVRFANWVRQSGLLLSADNTDRVHALLKANVESVDLPTRDEPIGDGSYGILEGYASEIRPDGRQVRRTPIRADCQAETAMALAVHAALTGDDQSRTTATNLLNFLYGKSGMQGGPRGDPKHPAFGLIAWGMTSPAWEVATYGDDNARTLLGTMLAAAWLKSDAWDEAMLKGLLANLRTTGKNGFRGDRIDIPALEQHGWRHYHDAETVNYAMNFEAYPWACYLWAYRQTGEAEFLEKARTALRITMAAYPDGWRWGDNLERARILLPLAWLVRVDDTPEHRGWIQQVAGDLLKNQDETGAIREHLGGDGKGAGHYVVPASNEAYGTSETPLIQRNGDPVADQLYTTPFALIGLHECVAATGDATLKEAEDRLAAFLVRIQTRSTKAPNLDGTWFRAFDFGQWDYWASSADVGWGAWCIEAGWGPTWAAATLGLRAQGTSLWDITSGSQIERHMSRIKPLMEK